MTRHTIADIHGMMELASEIEQRVQPRRSSLWKKCMMIETWRMSSHTHVWSGAVGDMPILLRLLTRYGRLHTRARCPGNRWYVGRSKNGRGTHNLNHYSLDIDPYLFIYIDQSIDIGHEYIGWNILNSLLASMLSFWSSSASSSIEQEFLAIVETRWYIICCAVPDPKTRTT
jgi:hypothetical protein